MKQYFTNPTISPSAVSAGDSYEIVVTLTANKDFDCGGGKLVYDLPATLGFSRPSILHQEDTGYIEVFCSNPNVRYKKLIWDMETGNYAGQGKESYRGMAQRMFAIQFESGTFLKDDIVTVSWGFMRNGYGQGAKVATVVPKLEYHARIDIQLFLDGSMAFPDYGRDFVGYTRPVAQEHHTVDCCIRPREATRMRVFHRGNTTMVAVYDRFYNVCNVETLSQFIVEDVKAVKNEFGVFVINEENPTITSKGLPISYAPLMNNVWDGYNIYFGDMHSHSSYSNDCVEREKLPWNAKNSMEYAKNAACVDFHAVTDHHQPWDEQRNQLQQHNWDAVRLAAKETTDATFVGLPGFEFRSPRGDTAVIVNSDVSYDTISDPGITEVNVLWDTLADSDYVTIPHFHMCGTLPDGEWIASERENVETVMEIYSCHGSYEEENAMERGTPLIKQRRTDRNARYLLNKGYHYGLVCNSDGHKGKPGMNGLTAVLAKDLSANAIFDAIRARRVYGTTNARIKLVFQIDNHIMGSIVKNASPQTLHLLAEGEADWKSIALIHNGEIVRTYKGGEKQIDLVDDISQLGQGYYYVRLTQIDNHIAYSSPIWFE